MPGLVFLVGVAGLLAGLIFTAVFAAVPARIAVFPTFQSIQPLNEGRFPADFPSLVASLEPPPGRTGPGGAQRTAGRVAD